MSIVGVGLVKSPAPSCVFEGLDAVPEKRKISGTANRPPSAKIVTGSGCREKNACPEPVKAPDAEGNALQDFDLVVKALGRSIADEIETEGV